MSLKKLLIPALIVFVVVIGLIFLFSGDSESDTTTLPQEDAAALVEEDTEPTGASGAQAQNPEEDSPAAQPASSGDTWLVMLYQDADDEVLEEDIFIDLNEAEMVGSTDKVMIVSQIDRMDGGYESEDDWTSTKRFLVQQDESGDLETLVSEELADLGEVDMGDKDTLVDFALWAIQTYPADKYALILSDHGAGWTGGWTDNDPTPDSQMYLNHIDEALAEITSQSGIGQLEMVGFDACLMAQIDVLGAVAPYARYMIASEETEPSLGWAYASFLGDLTGNPAMDGAELSEKIVESYITQDGRITDDDARKNFAKNVFSSANISADDAAEAMGSDITLTAFDLSKLAELNAALNDLVVSLQEVDQSDVAQARAYAQSYTSVFGDDVPASYIDLGSFASLIQDAYAGDAPADAAGTVIEAIQAAIVAEKHGPERSGSTGVTVYFPDGDLFQTTSDPDMEVHYPTISGRFLAASLWDDFLTFHYSGEAIDPSSADPSVIQSKSTTSDFSEAIQASALEEGAKITPPGAGEVDFRELSASAEEITTDETITLTVDLSGTNIGYIYIYTAYYDPDSDSYLTTDLDFIGSDDTQEVGGVSYPDWGSEADLSMDVEWEPLVWMISDGETSAIAAAEAETYGATAETTFYQVWGTYQKAGSEKTYDAFLRFNANGEFTGATIFTGSGENTTPREINPAPGDAFTVNQEWLEFTNDPEGEYAYYTGDTVTFGDNGFELVADAATSGDYMVGIVVEDLEGNSFEKYIEVTVTE